MQLVRRMERATSHYGSRQSAATAIGRATPLPAGLLRIVGNWRSVSIFWPPKLCRWEWATLIHKRMSVPMQDREKSSKTWVFYTVSTDFIMRLSTHWPDMVLEAGRPIGTTPWDSQACCGRTRARPTHWLERECASPCPSGA